MEKKLSAYKWIKIGGILSFVPVILASGPLAGYIVGSYFEEKLGWSYYIKFIFIGVGFIISILEAIRALKLVIKIDKKLN